MTNYQRTYSIGEVEVEGGAAIYHMTEHRERRDHSTLFACTRAVTGFDTSRDAFVGVHDGLHEAAVPFAGRATGSIAHGWNPIGSHEVDAATSRPARRRRSRSSSPTSPRAGSRRGLELLDRYAGARRRRRGVRRAGALWDELLSRFQVECPDEHSDADGQHLEPVPVHGDVQPVALGQPVRDRHRARHGLPRLEPGPARLRPPDPGPGAPANPRPRRDAALRRHVLPPVPAAHAAGERRDRRRLLRRPPLARPVDVRVRQGDRRHVDPARSRSATRTRRAAARTCCTTSRRASPTRWRTAARTACRSSGTPTGTTAST